MQASVTQCRFLLRQADRALAGLDDSHRAITPAPGIKTAGWLVGHMAVTGDFGRRLCGRTPICPKEWQRLFNPGTLPAASATEYPPMDALVAALRAVYTDLCTAAIEAGDELLQRENPFAPAREDYQTVGDFVAYLVSGHFGYHLGQLVAWRAAAGLGRLGD